MVGRTHDFLRLYLSFRCHISSKFHICVNSRSIVAHLFSLLYLYLIYFNLICASFLHGLLRLIDFSCSKLSNWRFICTRFFRSIKHFACRFLCPWQLFLLNHLFYQQCWVFFFRNWAISVEFLQCCMLLFLRDYSGCVDSSALMITSLCQLFYAPRMISVAIFIIIFAMGPYLAMLDNFVWLQYSLHFPNLS